MYQRGLCTCQVTAENNAIVLLGPRPQAIFYIKVSRTKKKFCPTNFNIRWGLGTRLVSHILWLGHIPRLALSFSNLVKILLEAFFV